MLVEKETVGNNESHNMLVKGDNVKVLRDLLNEGLAGKIDCMVIDPPYNVRSTFEHYVDNKDSSEWIGFMRERLDLAKQLISKHGTLWVIISDHECHYLKVMLDDLFGRKNFIADCAWQKMPSTHNHTKYLSKSYDHVLVYGKDKTSVKIRGFKRSDKMNAAYKNPDNDPKGPWKLEGITAPLLGMGGSEYKENNGKENFVYEIQQPGSAKGIFPIQGRCWKTKKEEMDKLISDGKVCFSKNGIPRMKVYLSDVRQEKVPGTFWPGDEFGTNSKAKKEVQRLFGEHHVFQTPKPERLLERILTMATDEGSMVLDCFAGSGTTMAVAHKMRRRYIGIEIGDQCETLCAQRLKKVIEGEQGGISTLVDWKGGGGFTYYVYAK
jgi:adenine-specific DNA-methyltransferase